MAHETHAPSIVVPQLSWLSASATALAMPHLSTRCSAASPPSLHPGSPAAAAEVAELIGEEGGEDAAQLLAALEPELRGDVEAVLGQFAFTLDPFQVRAVAELLGGKSGGLDVAAAHTADLISSVSRSRCTLGVRCVQHPAWLAACLGCCPCPLNIGGTPQCRQQQRQQQKQPHQRAKTSTTPPARVVQLWCAPPRAPARRPSPRRPPCTSWRAGAASFTPRPSRRSATRSWGRCARASGGRAAALRGRCGVPGSP
jgi:hypothetical protein